MQRWQYLRVFASREDIDAEWVHSTRPEGYPTSLEQLGAEGWELVSIVSFGHQLRGQYDATSAITSSLKPFGGWLATTDVTYYLKRQVEEATTMTRDEVELEAA